MSDREHVRGMKKQTDNKFLNMYELNAVDRNGREHPYYFATRRKDGDLSQKSETYIRENIQNFFMRVRKRWDKMILSILCAVHG